MFHNVLIFNYFQFNDISFWSVCHFPCSVPQIGSLELSSLLKYFQIKFLFILQLIWEAKLLVGSERNASKLTLDGVDVMGERLAQEVLEVIQRKPSLHKISFVAHSVGGLVARYAIGRLYIDHLRKKA